MNNKILLIDGMAILVRAFFGVPPMITLKGVHTNAVNGFLNMMFKFIEEENPEYITVAFDVHAPTFRHEMFEEYKGTRSPMPPELHEQVPIIQNILKAMNIQIVMKAGYEADDLLGTIAKKAETEGLLPVIVTGDRDLLQIASNKTRINIIKTGNTMNYFADDVKAEYGVTPVEFIDVKALMGDKADNIPGVAGIGPKTAIKLIQDYGCMERACEEAINGNVKPESVCKKLANGYKLAKISKELATIRTDVDLNDSSQFGNFSFWCAKIGDIFTDKAKILFEELGYPSGKPRLFNIRDES